MKSKKKINIEQQERSTLAFMEKLTNIKKASKDIKQKSKLTVHKVQWAKEFKYLNKVERNMERQTYDMLEALDVKFQKEFEDFQIFGKENQKSYTQLFQKHKEKVDTSNNNIWYQIDSLRAVISKLKQSPQFYVVEQVQSIIQNIGSFLEQFEVSLSNELQETKITSQYQNYEDVDQQSLFSQKLLISNQVKGFDIKKQKLHKVNFNENTFKQFLELHQIEMDNNQEKQLIEEFNKAMSFLNQRYQLEFEKLDMDYQDVLNLDQDIIQSQNYQKLCHLYNCYIGRGKDRGLYSQRLAIQFPKISRKNLDVLTAYVEAKIYKGKKRKTLWRNFYKQKSDLVDKAQQQILKTIQQKIQNGKVEIQKLQRKQEQIKLNQKLAILKKEFKKRKQQQQRQKKEQQTRQKQQQQKEAKLWKQHAEQVSKKAQVYKQQVQEKRRQSDILKKQQQKYQKQITQKKIIESKPKVQVRQSIQRRKIQQKLQKKQDAINSKIYKQQRIENAIKNYAHRPVVQADFERLKAPTTSLLNKKVQYDVADKVDLVKVHGYNINQLMSDMRYRLGLAFQQAGLSNAAYAKQVINQMSRPKDI